METRTRSILKALSWRFLATLITSAIVWILTKKGDFAAKVGLIDTTVKLVVYFFHERLWLRVSYGQRKTDFEI